MKFSLLPLAGLLPVLSALPAYAQAAGVPVLSTPGTATWLSEITTTGTRTVVTITGNTVLEWGQFNLGSGSELIFDFVGGNSVVNMLNGSGTHVIAGNVTSNGNVGFFSPHAPLRVTGTVTAENVTLATMKVDPHAFNGGGTFTMSSAAGSTLSVNGSVTATNGNVVLAGRAVRIPDAGTIEATKSVQIGAGSHVKVGAWGYGRRVEASGEGFVLCLGAARAPRIEVAAGTDVNVGGKLDAGRDGRIFLEVGQGGRIVREGTGLLVGRATYRGEVDLEGDPYRTETDEALAAVNNSSLNLPALTKPGGRKLSDQRTLVNDVPMTASADAGRDRKRPVQQVASRGNSKPVFQRNSFFGMRGGSGAKR